MQHQFKLNDLAATNVLAHSIAAALTPGLVISLVGNLGSGKTTLVREILHCFGVSGTIKSPTFTLVEPYQCKGLGIFHFDLYRFNDPEEWFYAGFDDYFQANTICLIEWADKAPQLLPWIDLELLISYGEEQQRVVVVTALTTVGRTCLTQLINSAAV